MSDSSVFPRLELQGSCPLPHLGLVRVQGDDALDFLHKQLTQDVQLLPIGQSRLTGYCNAQGRMQASGVIFKQAAKEAWLIIRRDLLPRTLKRLSMFVLRARVTLSDFSAQQAIWGLSGAVLSTFGRPPQAWETFDLPQGTLIGLYPVGDQPRALLLPRSDGLVAATMAHADWLAGEVLAGVADVQQSTFEAFIPQMLNYESVGGVNFKKGCYPGQEVVARSQFRGTLKRRTYLLRTQSTVPAGTEVQAGEESCGLIAQAATLPGDSGGVALACLLVSHAGRTDLQAGGVPMQALPLPYPLLQDI